MDEKPQRGTFGAEDGLLSRAPLPTDRCHLNDTAVRINRHCRDDTAVGEEYMIERTISIHQDLFAFAAYLSSSGISCWRSEDGRASRSRLRGQFDIAVIRPNAPDPDRSAGD